MKRVLLLGACCLSLLVTSTAAWAQTDPDGRAFGWKLWEAYQSSGKDPNGEFRRLFSADASHTKRAFVSAVEYATEVYQSNPQEAQETLKFAMELAQGIQAVFQDPVPTTLMNRMFQGDQSVPMEFVRYASQFHPAYAAELQQMQQQQQPGGNQGYQPGGNQGYQPGGNPGYQPGGNGAYGPGGNQGYQPGGNQGYQPGGDPGYQPGGNGAYGPGGNQGYQPGGNPGYQPNGNGAYGPGGNQGYPAPATQPTGNFRPSNATGGPPTEGQKTQY